MEARCLYFTVHSASNLVDVRKLGEMKVYAKVSIAGKSQCTEVNLVNKTNPEWNTTFSFIVPEKNIIHAQDPSLSELEEQEAELEENFLSEAAGGTPQKCQKSPHQCHN
ncbi:uncharacterized protein LOC129887880 [Solanum dulcamara]|uniref:uncharacterized protein LOC129887880 n=1 Tax=Solanum dulcamara TaxID=45834 RepID=UPI002485F5A6|nr:uncharacterized protein LOC129887880 [Solanum dulcamara]